MRPTTDFRALRRNPYWIIKLLKRKEASGKVCGGSEVVLRSSIVFKRGGEKIHRINFGGLLLLLVSGSFFFSLESKAGDGGRDYFAAAVAIIENV